MFRMKDYGFRMVGDQKFASFGSYGTYFLEDGPFGWSAWLEDINGNMVKGLNYGGDTAEEAFEKVVSATVTFFERATSKALRLQNRLNFEKQQFIAEEQQ